MKKLDRAISPGESFGTSMHSTLKKWGEAEMKKQKPVTLEDQLQLFGETSAPPAPQELHLEYLMQLWHTSFSFDGFASRTDADAARKRGEGILKTFFEWWQQEERTVIAVEKGFSIEREGTIVSGRFDRVEASSGGVKVIDYKTSAVRERDAIDADLQLSLYAIACEHAFQKPCTTLSFLFLREDGVTELSTVRTEDQLQKALDTVQQVGESIARKDYHALPAVDKCTRCPYKGVCPFSAV